MAGGGVAEHGGRRWRAEEVLEYHVVSGGGGAGMVAAVVMLEGRWVDVLPELLHGGRVADCHGGVGGGGGCVGEQEEAEEEKLTLLELMLGLLKA